MNRSRKNGICDGDIWWYCMMMLYDDIVWWYVFEYLFIMILYDCIITVYIIIWGAKAQYHENAQCICRLTYEYNTVCRLYDGFVWWRYIIPYECCMMDALKRLYGGDIWWCCMVDTIICQWVRWGYKRVGGKKIFIIYII